MAKTVSDILGLAGRIMEVKQESLKTLSETYQDQTTSFIPQENFIGVQVGDVITLDEEGKNTATCVYASESHIVYLTINEKGYKVQPHSHDFKEIIYVIEGKIKEKYSDNVAFSGESIEVRPLEIHSFEAHDFSVYTATITLNKK
jgi:quercetin dioxygenase-like cupin family protein